MAKKRKDDVEEFKIIGLFPLFILTVCIVFSFVFTVLTVPLGSLASDLKFVFIVLLVVSTTVASAVSLLFYIFFMNKNGK